MGKKEAIRSRRHRGKIALAHGRAAPKKAKELVLQFGPSVKLDATRRGRIEAYYELGRRLNAEMGPSRSKWYGGDLLAKIVAAWNRTQSPKLGLSSAKYARRLASLDASLLAKALNADIRWSGLMELCRAKVTAEQRGDIVERVRRRELDHSGVATAVRAILKVVPRVHKPGASQVEDVLRTVNRRLDALQRSVERLDQAAKAVLEAGDARTSAGIYPGIVEAETQATQCVQVLSALRKSVPKTTRR